MRTELLDEYKALMEKATATDDKVVWDALEKLFAACDRREQEYLWAYCQCVEEGCSPTLADMFASRQAPQAQTDATFFAGQWDQHADLPFIGDYRKKVAESLGQSVNGKVYVGGLARFPGDPHAWVDGRGDIQRVCAERGLGAEGAVNIPTPNVGRIPRPKRKPLAQKLHEAGLPIAGG